MPLLYGEGEKAFIRLQEAIISSVDDDSILAWGLSMDTPGTDICNCTGQPLLNSGSIGSPSWQYYPRTSKVAMISNMLHITSLHL